MNTAHKHHALMLEYAKDAAETDEPWSLWEDKVASDPDAPWLSLMGHPRWLKDFEYRRKPVKPKEPWIPERPTWCEVWDAGFKEYRSTKLVVRYDNEFSGYMCQRGSKWDYATPTKPPAWWPKEWT